MQISVVDIIGAYVFHNKRQDGPFITNSKRKAKLDQNKLLYSLHVDVYINIYMVKNAYLIIIPRIGYDIMTQSS